LGNAFPCQVDDGIHAIQKLGRKGGIHQIPKDGTNPRGQAIRFVPTAGDDGQVKVFYRFPTPRHHGAPNKSRPTNQHNPHNRPSL
jgi:hypothetical protein